MGYFIFIDGHLQEGDWVRPFVPDRDDNTSENVILEVNSDREKFYSLMLETVDDLLELV